MGSIRTVVLIDDDHDDFEIFSMALNEADPSITCIYYDSAKEALTKLTEKNSCLPEYIFLDLNMPGMNGLQFLENLKQTEVSHLPVIVYSTSILPPHREKIIKLGAFNSFIKPFSHSELTNILKSILRGS
jgi:CheY-like chemotaxis protein